ncbi:hypothetical protein B9Z55_002666 [Caenorhabditis nigoni]|uniref:Protein kinase domain-containing protein n=1 Tax=Caenorhabditis nigoni TaxID=1611254 RepID=A0A2G5VLT7_9PELO|nr:hypothetical protein B9Z55_002666 [Caenorhabditis nigoni]
MTTNQKTTDEISVLNPETGQNIVLKLENMKFLAAGAFSNVYRGIAETGPGQKKEIVIKKTWPKNPGKSKEEDILEMLRRLKHKNIVMLLYSYQKLHKDRTCLGLIFESMPSNLHQYLKSKNRRLDMTEVKLITWQLFRGQAHLQRLEVCHRDIKPQNLLFNPETGLLKISDFGSSFVQSQGEKDSYHVTRYYRPPELILGSKRYGCEIDIWSCGCVFGELLKGRVFLAGKSSVNQVEVIFDALGPPTNEDLKEMRVSNSTSTPIFQNYKTDHNKRSLNFSYLFEQSNFQQEDVNSRVMNEKISLEDMKKATLILRRILVYNPKNRFAGDKLLTNKFFSDLFEGKAVREDNKKIDCLTKKDLEKVQRGDKTTTHETHETRETCE